MSTDYEEFYKDNPHGLGKPFKELVQFFNDYKKEFNTSFFVFIVFY